jgi:arylsulfatase A-like enzyme
MMVGFPGPHCPYDPTEEYLRLFDPEDMPAPVPAAPDMPPDFRQGNINGNRSGWNGVDYSEFTLAHKKKIRAHYAALVKQIDDEIGTMLDALQESGRLENTIIVFCSDHGDYLGDHDLIGKGTFYESSTRVPLLVRMPGAEGGAVYDGVSSIEDITATLLHFGGVQIPGYCDSQPLPELGISGVTPRERIFGFLASGCMNFDGEWKLAKYASGVVQLFNLKEDPQEQHDRSADPMCMEVYRRLDAELTAQMLRSIQAAHGEKFVGSEAMWDNESFGREGWQRTYPHPISH